MAKDVIARLKADTSQWDSGMAKATRSLNKFKQDNMSLDSALQGSVRTLTSVAAKYVGWGAAAAGAMKVAKDAFMNTEQGIDSWGRTVSSAEGAYNTFLSTLNGGNWTSFFANLNDAIRGAADLYDKLDRLGSIKSNNVAAIAIKEQALAQSRLQLQEAMRKGDKAQIAALEETIRTQSKELADLRKMETSAGKVTGRAQMTEALKANVRGDADLKGVKINDATWDRVADNIAKGGQKYMDAYARQFRELTAKGMETRTTTYGSVATGDYRVEQEQYFNINKLTEEEKKRYAISKAATEAETQIQEGLSTYAQAVQQETTSATQQFRYNRYAGAGSGSGTGGRSTTFTSNMNMQGLDALGINTTESVSELKKMASEWQKAMDEAGDQFTYNRAQKQLERTKAAIEAQPQAMTSGMSAFDMADINQQYTDMMDSLRAQLEEDALTLNININTGNVTKATKSISDLDKNINGAASAFSAMGNAMDQLEDPGAKVAGYIASAVGQTAAAFGTAQRQAADMGPWAWITFAATGLATMISTITGIKSATAEYHAEGGIVGQSPFIPKGTDTVPAMLTPGEVVLSYSQQERLASNLTSNNGASAQEGGMSYISGENIVVAANAYLQRTGKPLIGR